MYLWPIIFCILLVALLDKIGVQRVNILKVRYEIFEISYG